MPQPYSISLQLAAFDKLTEPGSSDVSNRDGLLFFQTGADTRAAVTAPASQQAFRFLLFGIHADQNSAQEFIHERLKISPWLQDAKEVWAAVLNPFHHRGEANYLHKDAPGKMFEALVDSPGTDVPIAVITTAGWQLSNDLNMDRVKTFSDGVLGVRASMTGVNGLHSQQSFFFPGVLTHDPITVTLWKNAAAVGKFAYGAGSHAMQIEKQKAESLADRTSFTRCSIAGSEGSWHGTDPAK